MCGVPADAAEADGLRGKSLAQAAVEDTGEDGGAIKGAMETAGDVGV